MTHHVKLQELAETLLATQSKAVNAPLVPAAMTEFMTTRAHVSSMLRTLGDGVIVVGLFGQIGRAGNPRQR